MKSKIERKISSLSERRNLYQSKQIYTLSRKLSQALTMTIYMVVHKSRRLLLTTVKQQIIIDLNYVALLNTKK